MRLFSLSLIGAAFSWFASLPSNYFFLELLYSEDNDAKLTYLKSVKQGRDEPVLDYFNRFKDIKLLFMKKIWLTFLLVVCAHILEKSLKVLYIILLSK